MTLRQYPTEFAPGDRATDDAVRRQVRAILDMALLRQLCDAVTEIVIILNSQRQIVFYNQRLVECLGLSDPDALYGLRPGEALKCRHAFETPGGCGTTEFCRTCGAVNAIISSQFQDAQVRECRILQAEDGRALDFLVRATPLTLGRESYTVFAITDISHEKRRQALERIFFHDLMNTATGLEMFVKLLDGARPEQAQEAKEQLGQAVKLLMEQIRGQRDLAAAETCELAVQRAEIGSRTLLQNMIGFWQSLSMTETNRLALDASSADITFTSDPILLTRILVNMVKNAVEASGAGEAVTIGCNHAGDAVEFWVHNAACVPPDVQAQIFQRSFSTKGVGRGLGTYSMKLLGERYLSAQVSFTSSPEEGTRFQIRCPLAM